MSVRNILKQHKLSTQSRNARSTVIKRPLLEAREKAALIVADAEEKAQSMRLKTEQEIKSLRDNAYQDGYESALAEFNQLLFEARERRDSAISQVEKDLLELSVRLAEKIIGREIERDNKVLVEMIANALKNVRHQELLTIRINPADMPSVNAHRDKVDQFGRARFLDIVSDARVSRFGCIIESEFGTVDARLETQLRVLERALVSRATSGERD